MNSAGKQQHYIPCFLLRGFTDKKGRFWVFSNLTKRCEYASPDDSFCERGLYDLASDPGNPEQNANATEELFGEQEDAVAKLLGRAKKRVRNGETPVLSREERGLLAYFITFLAIRNPDALDSAMKYSHVVNFLGRVFGSRKDRSASLAKMQKIILSSEKPLQEFCELEFGCTFWRICDSDCGLIIGGPISHAFNDFFFQPITSKIAVGMSRDSDTVKVKILQKHDINRINQHSLISGRLTASARKEWLKAAIESSKRIGSPDSGVNGPCGSTDRKE